MLLSHSGFGLVAEVAGSNLNGAEPNHKKAVDTYTSYYKTAEKISKHI